MPRWSQSRWYARPVRIDLIAIVHYGQRKAGVDAAPVHVDGACAALAVVTPLLGSKELELLSTNILNWIKYRNEDRRLVKESFNLHAMVQQLFSLFTHLVE